jgi:MFS transporter, ACS family, glucarate transporter
MPKIPFRFFLTITSFILTVLLYVDRACISAAKDGISKDFDLSKTEFGWVLAVFTLGYALFQAPSGWLADKYGPRAVITSIVAIWSVLTALTGATFNFASMIVARFLFGAGEAGAFPALSKVVFNWYPTKERGIVQGINFSGSRIGAAFALPLVAALIMNFGWRMTFVILGVFGVAFAIVWAIIFRNTPEESNLVSKEEREMILATRQKKSLVANKLSFGNLFASRNVWLAMFQYICSNFTFYFTLTWMFPYIKERFALDAVTAGFYSSVPLLAGALGNWVSGYLVDMYFKAGRTAYSRKFPAILGFILAAVGIVMVTQTSSLPLAIVFMSLAVFGADMTLSPSWAFCIDIGRENSGMVSGVMNMAGNLGAFITIIAFPYMKQWTNSNVPFFYTCAVLSVLAIFTWLFMDPLKEIVGAKATPTAKLSAFETQKT